MPRLLGHFVAGLGLLTVFWICLWQFGHSMSIVILSRATIARLPSGGGLAVEKSQLRKYNGSCCIKAH